jgi:hypothetical protein
VQIRPWSLPLLLIINKKKKKKKYYIDVSLLLD